MPKAAERPALRLTPPARGFIYGMSLVGSTCREIADEVVKTDGSHPCLHVRFLIVMAFYMRPVRFLFVMALPQLLVSSTIHLDDRTSLADEHLDKQFCCLNRACEMSAKLE